MPTAAVCCCKCSDSDLQGVSKVGLTRGNSGAKGTRTPNPLLAKQVRYQLRHGPIRAGGPIPESGPADPRSYVMAGGRTNPENLTRAGRDLAISRSGHSSMIRLG